MLSQLNILQLWNFSIKNMWIFDDVRKLMLFFTGYMSFMTSIINVTLLLSLSIKTFPCLQNVLVQHLLLDETIPLEMHIALPIAIGRCYFNYIRHTSWLVKRNFLSFIEPIREVLRKIVSVGKIWEWNETFSKLGYNWLMNGMKHFQSLVIIGLWNEHFMICTN